jgi:hypothetical protein
MDTNEQTMTEPRPLRAAEYWELMYERFPGATVLDDLAHFTEDVAGTKWILVRYAAVRAVADAAAGPITAREVRIARNIGLNQLAYVPMLDREAWSLKKMLESLDVEPTETMVGHLLNAGVAAMKRGHVRGAYAMFHCAYKICLKRKWPAAAGRAARGIEEISRASGAVYSPRLWRRRAKVMERRAAVA